MAGTEDERKRAENLVWTAAGDYAFTPDFLSFTEDGSADLYMNLVIGLAHKWLGRPTEALLEEVSRSRRAAILSDTLWLGIESYVYARELPSRPALETLRVQHAEAYFAHLQNLNRQQWMAENKRLLDQQTIRWSRVLGRKTRVYAPDRRALAAALELDPTLRADEVAATLRAILTRFFAYRGEAEVKPVHIRLNTVEAWILQHVFRTEHQHTDTLMMKNTYAANASAGTPVASDGKHGGAGAMGDRAYITACFGRSLYTDEELQQLEARLCVGGHRGCHVYVTDGKFGMGSSDGLTWLREKSGAQMNDITRTNQRTEDGAGKASGSGTRTDVAAPRGGFFDSETAKVRQDSAQQALANRRFFESEGELARSLVRRLSARLELTLSDLRENVAVHAPVGRLDPVRAWRMPVVHDPDVFEKQRPEREMPLDVTLLLDASASRMQMQEQLAAEAWILAEALKNCHMPAAVWNFRSLRGYTVLEKMKDFSERDCAHLFHFYAAGWNRDGLGLRLAAEELLHGSGRSFAASHVPDSSRTGDGDTGARIRGGSECRTADARIRDAAAAGHSNGRKHILIVLTDASPDDSTRLSACEKYPFGSAYEGRPAVDDAADAIAEMRAQGILVYGLFLGRTENLGNLSLMYGHHQVRIHDIAQLARAAGEIFTKAVEEL
ncbi:hypothetical protein [Oribacterium sp. P9]|uniref:hypothetical protein n=1 Tax=Oribacterium sp. P9 TaxID=3378068 RepID=UPI003966B2A1